LLKCRIWTLSIGFTISFGAIFSKTWRVHTIFTNVNASKRVEKEEEDEFTERDLFFCFLYISKNKGS